MVAEYSETSDYFYFENQYNSSDGDGETAICKICGDVTYFTGDSPSEQSNLDDHLRTHGLDFAPDLNKWINVESYANESEFACPHCKSDDISTDKYESFVCNNCNRPFDIPYEEPEYDPYTESYAREYNYDVLIKGKPSKDKLHDEFAPYVSVEDDGENTRVIFDGTFDGGKQELESLGYSIIGESYASEDSLVKIEDDDDKDTKVTVLDEWENETDPDVGGDVKGLDQSELEEVDYNNIGESRTFRSKYECEHCNCGFKSNESLSLHYNDIHALPPTHIEGYENWKDVAVGLMEEQSKKYQSKKKKGSESELEDARSNMSFWKNELEGLGDYIGHDEELAKTLGAPYQNDGESYNPDEFVCPECGFKSIDQKEFDDHLSAHSFEIGDF